MNAMTQPRRLPLALLASLVSTCAAAAPVATAPLGEPVERQLSSDQRFRPWVQDPALLEIERGDRLEVQQVAGEELQTVKLRHFIPPIRFESGVAQIPHGSVEKLAEVLGGLRDRTHVRVHFVGHADAQPLSDALARVFEDNAGLSRERAGEVAEHFKTALGLPPESIAYEWAGDTRPIASNATPEGRALNRRVEVEVWYDEPRSTLREQEVLVAEEIKRVKVCRMETVCKLRYQEGHARRARLRNLVQPLRYDDETTAPSPEFVHDVARALAHLADKRNVVVRLVGHTDAAPLTGRNERIYGDHLALSKARARRVALELQQALGLPTAGLDSDGRGTGAPVASNETAQGRALNRRIEVEFWYDDPLQQLPDEPQLCPGDGSEMVTRVYDPPWGALAPLELRDGRPVVPAGYAAQLRRALDDVAGRTRARLRYVGYTRNERLDRRTAAVYGDDVGLSVARARRTLEALRQDPLLADAAAEHEGRGFVVADDVVEQGFVQGEASFVRVQVVYDEPAPLDDLEGVDVTRISRELTPRSPYALNLMRITVDGKPIDDPNRSSADVQRCTDVALDDARIQFRFDNLASRPRLGIAAQPASLVVAGQAGEAVVAAPVRFRMYANYGAFIDRAEVRVFPAQRSLQSAPLAVLPVDAAGVAEWLPSADELGPPGRELRYVLRAYDGQGRFDETAPQPLWVERERAATPAADAGAPDTPDAVRAEPLAAYGETSLALHNIALGSGTVRVQGSGVPARHSVWVAGREVPVDANGRFVAEEILPDGAHTVEVAVLDEAGNGSLYLRDLEFERNDWFYVAMADLTLAETRTNGPAAVLQGAESPRDFDSGANGRLAFYLNGKFAEDWKLVASADTQEGPLDDLFSNFLDKSPVSLFRRIDPDHHYPTFGDDGVVEEMAPTLGKFYVKASKGANHALWGNFKVGYAGNELAQVDRGLYGANGRYASEATTGFGERRLLIDGFAAEPGTVPSY